MRCGKEDVFLSMHNNWTNTVWIFEASKLHKMNRLKRNETTNQAFSTLTPEGAPHSCPCSCVPGDWWIWCRGDGGARRWAPGGCWASCCGAPDAGRPGPPPATGGPPATPQPTPERNGDSISWWGGEKRSWNGPFLDIKRNSGGRGFSPNIRRLRTAVPSRRVHSLNSNCQPLEIDKPRSNTHAMLFAANPPFSREDRGGKLYLWLMNIWN